MVTSTSISPYIGILRLPAYGRGDQPPGGGKWPHLEPARTFSRHDWSLTPPGTQPAGSHPLCEQAPVTEQALVINVAGFGLVLISGCGHPRIEQILGITERVLDVPINAVVGGLHLPVHRARTPLVPQAVIATPTRPGSRSANATPSTCWTRSKPAAHSSSPCPGTTAHHGPTTRSPAASATATAPCEPGKNCASPPRPGAEPATRDLRWRARAPARLKRTVTAARITDPGGGRRPPASAGARRSNVVVSPPVRWH